MRTYTRQVGNNHITYDMDTSDLTIQPMSRIPRKTIRLNRDELVTYLLDAMSEQTKRIKQQVSEL